MNVNVFSNYMCAHSVLIKKIGYCSCKDSACQRLTLTNINSNQIHSHLNLQHFRSSLTCKTSVSTLVEVIGFLFVLLKALKNPFDSISPSMYKGDGRKLRGRGSLKTSLKPKLSALLQYRFGWTDPLKMKSFWILRNVKAERYTEKQASEALLFDYN